VATKNKAPNIRILTIRDQKVVLDVDLVHVYGATTKRLNEQFRRNRNRFPKDFAFQLTTGEFEFLRSQIATLNESNRGRADPMWSQTATGSSADMRSQTATGSKRNIRYRPWVRRITSSKHLRSDRAIAMSVYVIRTFVEQRERLVANAAILKRLTEIDKTLIEHDTVLRDIYQKLLPLLAPPPDTPRRQIGFSATS
jgi:hypothetical protein